MKSLVGKKIKVGTNEVDIIYFYVNYWKGGLKSNWAHYILLEKLSAYNDLTVESCQ